MKYLPSYRLYCLVALYTFFLSFFAGAQSLSLLHYTQEQGLPSDIVYSAMSDSKGYLWIGTDKGLCRYNGHSFKTYTTLDGLPDNEVFSCREDKYNRLWISTFKGDLCFFKDNVFHTAANTPWLRLPGHFGQFFTMLLSSHDSSMISLSSVGFFLLRIKGDNVRAYDLRTKPWFDSIFRQHIGISYAKKTSPDRWRIQTRSYLIDTDSSFNALSIRKANYTAVEWRDSVLLLDRHRILDFNERPIVSLRSLQIESPPYNYYSILPVSKDRFLISSKTKLFLNDQVIFQSKGKLLSYISNDINGSYWLVTKGEGLYRINEHFEKLKVMPEAYTEQIVYARHLNNVVYFISNNGTVYSLDKGTPHRIAQLRSEGPEELTKDHLCISDNADILQFHISRGCYLISPGKSGNPQSRKIEVGKSMGFKGILPSGEYTYLFSLSGVLRAKNTDVARGTIAYRDTLLNDQFNFSYRIYAKALNRTNNEIWYSRKDGLYRLHSNKPTRVKQLSSFVFRQLDFYGPYLVGITDDSRLLVCNTGDERLKWDTAQGRNCIWEQFYPIDHRRAIVSTNNYYRLLTFHPADAAGRPSYTLQAVEDPFIPQKAEYVAADSSRCYFFKDGAITAVDINVLQLRTPPPIPVFSTFRADRTNYPIRPQISVSYAASKNISLTFDYISFMSDDITCEYAITKEGEQEEWVTITGNEINLNTPGFGNYTIKIRSKTLASGYSKPAVLQLVVLKPFWATWWFITICLLALIALIWGIVLLATWRKLRKKQRQHESEMKYQQSEYKALNALMNPHFIFNSLNNIQGLINKDEKRIANEYLVIFSDLVRQNMTNISKGFINLQQELNLVENYLTLEKLRFKELINYEIQVEEEVDTEDIMIPPLMIQPLVENAVKHGLLPKQSSDSKVYIHVYEEDNLLYVQIKDNGIGLTQSLKNKNKLHDSFGLINLQKRTEHLRKIQRQEISIDVNEVKDDNGKVQGCLATIVMDLQEN